jgi:hypothetical protein
MIYKLHKNVKIKEHKVDCSSNRYIRFWSENSKLKQQDKDGNKIIIICVLKEE